MNSVRTDWEILCEKCGKLDLSGPAMHPARLGKDKFTVYVPDTPFCHTSADVNDAIVSIMCFLRGYEEGIKKHD